MKTSSFKLLILVMAILVCSLVSQGQATLAFRCTFNDAIHVGTLQEYGVEGTLGAGGYIYIKALSTDIATTAGQGASGNKALVFDEQGDELQIRRWVAPIDQFAEADLTQVASGMSFGYWLMVDTHSSSPMLLLGTRSGDMPNGNISITHGLRHNGAASPYTSRRAAVEIWTHGGTTSATEFTADVWHHLIFTYSAGAAGSVTKKIYIDGSLALTPTTSGSVNLMPSGAHRIGGFWNGSTYTESYYGKLDQFDVWDTELTSGEVTAAFNAGPEDPGPADPGTPWLRLTFNVAALGTSPSPDVLPNQGSDPNYYGKAYNLTYVDETGDPNDGKVVIFPEDPNSDSWINVTDDLGSPLPQSLMDDNGMTIAFWLKYDVVADATVTPTNYSPYLNLFSNGNLSSTFHTGEGAALDLALVYPNPEPAGAYTTRRISNYTPNPSAPTADPGVWYHIVYTWTDPNETTQKIYVDGVLKQTLNTGHNKIDWKISVLGGPIAAGDTFVGHMNQFDIFDTGLNAIKVATLFTDGPLPFVAPATCAEANAWGFGLSYDLDDDCEVGVGDFGEFNKLWLKCMEPGGSGCDRPWDL